MKLIIVLTGVCFFVAFALPIVRDKRTESCQQRVDMQMVVCGLHKLEQVLARIPSQTFHPCPPPPGGLTVSCEPNISNSIATQTNIVASYPEYILKEQIIDDFIFRDQLVTLLDVINSTLPQLHVNTSVVTSDHQPSIPICDGDATFRPACALHIVNWSLQHLVSLQRNSLPNCSFCKQLDETHQREIEPLRAMLTHTLRELIPIDCREEFASLNTPDDCNNPFDLHERLKSLTMWLNDSLSSVCFSLPGVHTLIERFSYNVLPVTGKALEILQLEDSCTRVQRSRCEQLPRTDILRTARQLAQCFVEPQQATVLEILYHVQVNFNHLFDSLVFEGILPSSCE